MPFAEVMAVAALAYLFVQIFVCAILVIAGRPIDPASRRWTDVVRQALASIGDLGAPPRPAPGMAPRRRHDDPADDSGSAGASESHSESPSDAPGRVRVPRATAASRANGWRAPKIGRGCGSSPARARASLDGVQVPGRASGRRANAAGGP